MFCKERITHTPYYMITDDGIIMNSALKTYEVHFTDVECFYPGHRGNADHAHLMSC